MRSFAHRSQASRLLVPLAAVWLFVGGFAASGFAEEGLRRIESPRFGVAVMAPGGWRLMEWSENDRAFALHLPQERSSSDGYVRCELASAPERLADFQKQNRDRDEREQQSGNARRKLVSDVLEGPAAREETAARVETGGREGAEGLKGTAASTGTNAAVQPQRLVTSWELLDDNVKPGGDKRFEVVVRLVHEETLYTFTLISDEAHFAAYRADFDDLVASAKLTPPEAGLKAAADGYWLQPEFQFALRPPTGWKPSFGASDRALWFAHGAAHGLFVDNVSVSASARAPLDLAGLRNAAPETIAKSKPAAQLVSCQIVPQGTTSALETILASDRDGVAVTIVERQFSGARRNYQIRVTCEASTFKEQEAEIRKALESFRELAEQAPPQDL